MSIVLTAPSGAWAIEWAGKRFLNVRSDHPGQDGRVSGMID